MVETFMINQLTIKSKSMMKLDKLQQEKKMITQTTRCLLDYQYLKDYYQLIAVGPSKQKELDADPRAIQQTEFHGMLKTNSQVCTVEGKSKETILEFYKGTAKVLNI